MNKNYRHRRYVYRISTIVAVILIEITVDVANAQHFDDKLIDRVRIASRMVPGQAPIEVRFQPFAYYSGPMFLWVENAPADAVPGVIGVFQIRYHDGWIIVDGGATKEMISWKVEYSDEEYALVGEALRSAKLVVATHEHADHIAGIVRGPWSSELARRALLTFEQLDGLMKEPDHPGIRISPEYAEGFMSVKYKELLPISPGMVLIKAAGHTSGSQIVYVRLDSGAEILLVGDVVWVVAALDTGSQRPPEVSASLGEDRHALAMQIQWLQRMREAGLSVIAAHDALALDQRIAAGVIDDGIYLGPAGND